MAQLEYIYGVSQFIHKYNGAKLHENWCGIMI